MVNQACWRCLSRLSLGTSTRTPTQPLRPTGAALFSTSQPVSVKKSVQTAKPAPKSHKSTKRMRKKKVQSKGKPPAFGERKAIAKRIVLSNTNALDVPGLIDLHRSDITNDVSIGTMAGLPLQLLDPLRAIEAFQPTQAWGYFKRPATLVRKETVQFAQFINEQSSLEKDKNNEPLRRIITGPSGSGKSVLMLQIQALALQAGWVVIHIPDAQAITSAKTAYAPLPGTNPVQYYQKTYTAGLLSRTVKANDSVLSSLKILQNHDFLQERKSVKSLKDLATIGANEAELSWTIFQALWSELTSVSEKRPPILFSLDSIAFICRLSDYLAPTMHNIHGFDFAIVDHFLSYLTGSLPLPHGGMVLATECASNRPATPSLDLAMKQSEHDPHLDSGAKVDLPLHDVEDPYFPHDPRVVARMRTVPTMSIAGISRDEAKTLLEYYASSGMFQSTITEALVAEKWSLSGGGLLGELENATLKRGHRVL